MAKKRPKTDTSETPPESQRYMPRTTADTDEPTGQTNRTSGQPADNPTGKEMPITPQEKTEPKDATTNTSQTPQPDTDSNGADSHSGKETHYTPTKTEPTTKNTQHAPQSDRETDGNEAGEVILTVDADGTLGGVVLPEVLQRACEKPGETRKQCWERLRQAGRTAGLNRRLAITYAGFAVEQVWTAPPPPEPEPVEEPEPEPIAEIPEFIAQPEGVFPESPVSTIVDIPAADQGVSGLGDLPESWGELPANASLQVEISWVSANRLRVRDGSGVDLSKALSPAPSYSALSWLETSILFPSKFADISVKATANQDDEKEQVRRERMAIDEIRGLLAEMLEE